LSQHKQGLKFNSLSNIDLRITTLKKNRQIRHFFCATFISGAAESSNPKSKIENPKSDQAQHHLYPEISCQSPLPSLSYMACFVGPVATIVTVYLAYILGEHNVGIS
jgi:hypothetical protein